MSPPPLKGALELGFELSAGTFEQDIHPMTRPPLMDVSLIYRRDKRCEALPRNGVPKRDFKRGEAGRSITIYVCARSARSLRLCNQPDSTFPKSMSTTVKCCPQRERRAVWGDEDSHAKTKSLVLASFNIRTQEVKYVAANWRRQWPVSFAIVVGSSRHRHKQCDTENDHQSESTCRHRVPPSRV